MVRRLDSCGLGLFLGHAFGDEGAGGRGVLVRERLEERLEEDMEVIRTRTRTFAPSGVLSCDA